MNLHSFGFGTTVTTIVNIIGTIVKSVKPVSRAFIFTPVIAAMAISTQLVAEPMVIISVDNSWIRQAPPNAKVLAAYLELTNSSDKTHSLIKISSDKFEKIEIHRSSTHEGMVHMQQQDKVLIPAGQKIMFEPGGLHLMLINPKQRLKIGDQVPLKFWFENDSTINVSTPVLKRKTKESHSHLH
jgi:copper(I)-binding protein